MFRKTNLAFSHHVPDDVAINPNVMSRSLDGVEKSEIVCKEASFSPSFWSCFPIKEATLSERRRGAGT